MEKTETPLYKKILTALLCLLVAVYVVYHIALNFKKEIELFPVRGVSITDSETFTGYIFNDSVALVSYAGGNCYYPYENGEKVGAGKIAAYVYRSGSAALTAQIEDLEKQIDILRAGSRIGGTDIDDVQAKIDHLSYEMSQMTAAGNAEAAARLGREMLVYMAKKDLLTSGKTDYASEILSLEMQISSYLASMGSPAETVFTPESGYFYRGSDGLESVFTTSAAEKLTPQSFDAITKSTGASASTAVGVLVTDHHWYFAAKTDAQNAEGFTVGETYDCVFPDNAYTKSLPMTLENKMTDGTQTLVVFSCDSLPAGFEMQRCQRVEIVREELRGYRVPADEVRVQNGVTIVYIFKEGIAVPREIDIIMEQNGYYIVSSKHESKNGGIPLSQNDLIIVGEEGLYDGKIVG